MNIITKYSIDWLKKQTVSTFDETVVEVGWTVKGFDKNTGTKSTYSGSTKLNISSITSGSFTDYTELTPQLLVGWVEDELTDEVRTAISSSLINDIERIQNTSVLVSNNFPWES